MVIRVVREEENPCKSDLTTTMQEIIISQELQQARSAMFGGYRRRRHDRPTHPEVVNHVFFRRPSRRHSRRHAKCVIRQRDNSVFYMTKGKDNNYFEFNFDELTTFDDDIKRLSDTVSSGFYEASERSSISSSCSSNNSISSIVSERQWGFQVM